MDDMRAIAFTSTQLRGQLFPSACVRDAINSIGKIYNVHDISTERLCVCNVVFYFLMCFLRFHNILLVGQRVASYLFSLHHGLFRVYPLRSRVECHSCLLNGDCLGIGGPAARCVCDSQPETPLVISCSEGELNEKILLTDGGHNQVLTV